MPIYRQKDGSYLIQVSYKDPYANKYKKISCKRKGIKRVEAVFIEQELMRKADLLSTGSIIDKTEPIDKVALEFLEYEETRIRKITLRHRKQVMRDYVINYFNDQYIKVLEFQTTFLKWRNYLDQYVSKRTGQRLTTHSKNSIIRDFSTFINYLAKYYSLNPQAFKNMDSFRNIDDFELVKIQFWTLEEFLKVNAELPDDTYKQQCAKTLINVLFFTGMRKSEAYPLTWKDLFKKDDNYFFTIRKALSQKVYTDGQYTITGTKNRSSMRNIMLTDYLVDLIQKLKERAINALDDSCIDSFIFGGGVPISDTFLAETLNLAADKAGVHRIKVHDLRHSFVTMLINNNVNIKTISALVGHANTKMTWDVYGHLYPEKENQAIKKLNDLMKKPN